MTPAGEFMIKRLIVAIIGIAMIIAGSAMLVYGQEMDIDITEDSDSITVTERISIEAVSGDVIEFWIKEGATDIQLKYEGTDVVLTHVTGTNIYVSNVSFLSLLSDFELSYKLDKGTTEFQKELLYNFSSLTITFDGVEIFSGTNLKTGNIINVALQEEAESQTVTVENIPTWIYIVIIVLVALLIASLIRSGGKQKAVAKKESTGGSEELLSTRKSLLMEILKEIEKKHRSKQISDDTYHKLKNEFKQDAVETMKKLDDMK
jgi:hypothetical protein